MACFCFQSHWIKFSKMLEKYISVSVGLFWKFTQEPMNVGDSVEWAGGGAVWKANELEKSTQHLRKWGKQYQKCSISGKEEGPKAAEQNREPKNWLTELNDIWQNNQRHLKQITVVDFSWK